MHYKNYCQVLMVIFYLQTQWILHPLYALQEVPSLEPKVESALIMKLL